ncbi:hypothetical protein C1645_819251 [Glomus cerebriforme]|uniref:Uncharacterized protein n=1 Tax=Glomus cerebriforme TaxID=658196 RepID=A0A397T5Q2_9GLOM|nr:hypothetical protein C1645_819251 [Glomus cerebriforme]
MFKPIIDSAKSSSYKVILYEILDDLKSTSQEKVLQIGFDYLWSYFRNAYQASRKFLYLSDLSGYNYQLVIGFHTVENSHVIRKSENDSSKLVYKKNFDGTSRQMKHAILFALLNNIMPILEESDFILYICVDGDLETNQTLVYIPAVNHIFADLKKLVFYKSKESEQIRKDIFWPLFGEILRDFDVIVKCVTYHAFAKKSAYKLCDVCSFYVNVDCICGECVSIDIVELSYVSIYIIKSSDSTNTCDIGVSLAGKGVDCLGCDSKGDVCSCVAFVCRSTIYSSPFGKSGLDIEELGVLYLFKISAVININGVGLIFNFDLFYRFLTT